MMYKLVIADDEKVIQEGLLHQVDWEQLGFEIVGAFCDGDEVIEYLNTMPVDVVLTDIMMPHIGGIEIARYVKNMELPCKIVFISGHKEFELALQAIKYGVQDYILKPSKEEDIENTFYKIRRELDEKKEQADEQNLVKERWAQMRHIWEENFLINLVMGAFDKNADIKQKMQFLYPEIEDEKAPCILADLTIAEYDRFLEEKWNYSSDQFADAVYNFVRIYRDIGKFHVIYKQKERICLFVILNEYAKGEIDKDVLCSEHLSTFAREFQEIFGVEITLKIEAVFSNVYQVSELREKITRKDHQYKTMISLLQEQKKMILTNIMMGNISVSQKILKNLLKSLSDGNLHDVRQFVVELFSSMNEMLRENNLPLFKLIHPFVDYHSILSVASLRELEIYCNRILDKMKSRESLSDQYSNSGLVNHIKAYVQDHIQEDILLENVANEVFLSTVHLGRIFKKQTGENFQQYVTRKKMEKAAELFHDPHYKVYQVSEYLGYKTPWYFAKVFYRCMGYYPSQYRKEVLNMQGVEDEE